MIRLRRIIFVLKGRVPARDWLMAALEEPPIELDDPIACPGCPLRNGGEWEMGARSAIAEMEGFEKNLLQDRWGCHKESRPCAGVRRLIAQQQGA